MGLTLHYTIRAPRSWRAAHCLDVLRSLHKFVAEMNPLMLTDVMSCRGHSEVQEFVDKIAPATRHVSSEWHPGSLISQLPSTVAGGFATHLAKGAESFELYLASYPQLKVPPRKLKPNWHAKYRLDVHPYLPYWQQALKGDSRTQRRFAKSVFASFAKAWNLKRLKTLTPSDRDDRAYRAVLRRRYLRISSLPDNSYLGWVSLIDGRRLGSRRGLAAPKVWVFLQDINRAILYRWEYLGDPNKTEQFNSPEFLADLKSLAAGRLDIIAGDRWLGRGFCKTQYACNPKLGGVDNFLKAHLGLVRILDHASELGLEVDVYDEGGYWETRNEQELVSEVEASASGIAAMVGALKDMVGSETADRISSPILDNPDFEHLEAAGVKSAEMGNLLDAARAVTSPRTEEKAP